jgi:lysophospholipase L1-like esterase
MAKVTQQKLKNIAIVVFIVVVCDLAFAQILKHSTDFWIATYPAMDHRIRSEKFHHELVKNREIDERWGPINYSFATNSLGFKDAKIRNVPLKVAEKRIMFLGDSFTEGIGFTYTDTFVGIISDHYKKKNIRVLNGGVASYAPEIYYRKSKYLIEELGLELDHVVVFLDVSDIRDEIVKYKLKADRSLIIPNDLGKKAVNRVGHWLRDNTMSVRMFVLTRDNVSFLKKHIRRRLKTAEFLEKSYWDITVAEMTAHAVVPHVASEWTYSEATWKTFAVPGLRKAANNMRLLADFLKTRWIGLTLAVYPWPDQIINDSKAPRHRGFWQKWAKKKNIPFVDLFPVFTADEPYKVLGQYFLPNDMHWNGAGHELVAKEFLRQFKMSN